MEALKNTPKRTGHMTICDELTGIAIGLQQDIADEMIQSIIDDPGFITSQLEENPRAVRALFGEEVGGKLLLMAKTLDAACTASGHADSANI